VSDARGALFRESGIPIPELTEYAARHGTIQGFPEAEALEREALFAVDCDVLVPAAMEQAITAENAPHIRASLIVEGANLATTREADRILEEKGITVVPDILANAGGVTVSYLEWVQGRQEYYWSEEHVVRELEQVMLRAFEEVHYLSTTQKISMRTAAHQLAVQRVAEAMQVRGIFP